MEDDDFITVKDKRARGYASAGKPARTPSASAVKSASAAAGKQQRPARACKDEQHPTFAQKHTFVCACGCAFAGARPKTTCTSCDAPIEAQRPGTRGGSPGLYGLFCCDGCGHHFSVAGVSEHDVETCKICYDDEVKVRFILPKAMVAPWKHEGKKCRAAYYLEIERLAAGKDMADSEEMYADVPDNKLLDAIVSKHAEGAVVHKGLLQYIAKRFGVDEAKASAQVLQALRSEIERRDALAVAADAGNETCDFCSRRVPKKELCVATCEYKGDFHQTKMCGGCKKEDSSLKAATGRGLSRKGCLECRGFAHLTAPFAVKTSKRDLYCGFTSASAAAVI